MAKRIYLDHNASTPLAPEAARAMTEALESTALCGNPSSIHAEGRETREMVEAARREVSAFLHCDPSELIFTSSGTEAVALGLIGLTRAAIAEGAPPRVLIGATEHPCVHGAAAALAREGVAVATLAVDRNGVIDLDRARGQISGGAAVVCVGLANHEVGTVQPIEDIARLAADGGSHVFCDAVQAAGKIDIHPEDLGVSALAVSAHKWGGPKGVGVLWLRFDITIDAAIGGGHQERERRPGTENVVGLVGAAAAAKVAAADRDAMKALTKQIEDGAIALGAEVVGAEAERIGNTACLRFPGAPAETMVQALDVAGFAVSAGAACTSGSLEPSPVLMAMGYDEVAATEAVRVSIGRTTTGLEVEALLEALADIVGRVRHFAK